MASLKIPDKAWCAAIPEKWAKTVDKQLNCYRKSAENMSQKSNVPEQNLIKPAAKKGWSVTPRNEDYNCRHCSSREGSGCQKYGKNQISSSSTEFLGIFLTRLSGATVHKSSNTKKASPPNCCTY